MDTAVKNLSEKNDIQAYQKQLLFGTKEVPNKKGDRN